MAYSISNCSFVCCHFFSLYALAHLCVPMILIHGSYMYEIINVYVYSSSVYYMRFALFKQKMLKKTHRNEKRRRKKEKSKRKRRTEEKTVNRKVNFM